MRTRDTMFFIMALVFACVAIFVFRKLRAQGILKRVDYIVLSAFTLFSIFAALTCLEKFFPSIFFLANGQMIPRRTLFEEFTVFLYYYGGMYAISALFDYLFIKIYFKLRGFPVVNTMTRYAVVYTLCATPGIFIIVFTIYAAFVGC